MKYIAFWEFNERNIQKILIKFKEINEKFENNPQAYPKPLSVNYSKNDKCKCFMLCETDKPELLSYFLPSEMHLKFEPIVEPIN